MVEYKQSEDGSSNTHILSIDDDPLTQVLGKKSKGLPGVGSFVSKSKYNAALHPYLMYSGEKGEKRFWKASLIRCNHNLILFSSFARYEPLFLIENNKIIIFTSLLITSYDICYSHK